MTIQAYGTLSDAYETSQANGACGEAMITLIDRKSGRTSRCPIRAEGAAFEELRDSWYDGYIGHFMATESQDGLLIIGRQD